jgi:hypothetical protein
MSTSPCHCERSEPITRDEMGTDLDQPNPET